MTPHDRAVLERLVAALADTFTRLGHRAQTVEHESLGVCSWKGCSPTCLRQQQLLLDATDWLERETTATPRQAGFWEAAG